MTSLKHKVLCVIFVLQTVAALTLAASFYVEIWHLELLVSFMQPALTLLLISLVLTSVLVLVFGRLRSNWPLLAAMGAAWAVSLYVLFFSLTTLQPITVAATSGRGIRFATFNRLYTNTQEKKFTAYLKEQDIDVLALQETNPEEVDRIADELGYEYTYATRRFATSGGNVVAIISRLPFEAASTVELATEHPVARAVIKTPSSGSVAVYAVHIPVPSTRWLYQKRNAVIASLAEKLKEEEFPVIAGGDFNTTVFSPALRSFNAHISSTVRPVVTERWPSCSWYGLGSPLCIRIDHIYVPRTASIEQLMIGPDLGSDHRPLIATIRLQ